MSLRICNVPAANLPFLLPYHGYTGQWLASLIAISTGCVVLCQFNRCAYTTAAVLYMIGMILDILSALFW